MNGDFEKGALYPFCTVGVGLEGRYRVENLMTGERFGTHDNILAAVDEAEALAKARRAKQAELRERAAASAVLDKIGRD